MTDDHEALLRAVAAGEVQALERLYRELRVPVFAVALSVLRDRTAAEDVLHDTFVRIAEHAHAYRPRTRPRAWVLAIARNLAIDAARRRRRHRVLEEQPAAPEPAPDFSWAEALMTLDAVEREIVALRVLGGLTHAEIAAHLGVPAGTVRWRYRLALRRLAPLVAEASDG